MLSKSALEIGLNYTGVSISMSIKSVHNIIDYNLPGLFNTFYFIKDQISVKTMTDPQI